MAKDRMMRVDKEFYDWIMDIADKNGKSRVGVTRDMVKGYKNPTYGLPKFKPKKVKMQKFTL